MTDSPSLPFHQTLAQLRRSGARGGKACARSRRDRLRTALTPPAVAPLARHLETAAEAIAVLDAQFPWLCGVESGLPAEHP